MKYFLTGETYDTRSICDYNCIFKYKIIKRTKKTVTIYDPMIKRNKNCRVFDFDGVEAIRPQGSYSMAPILKAK